MFETGHDRRQCEEKEGVRPPLREDFQDGRRRRHFPKVPEFASEEELEFKPKATRKDLECL